jgi:hypothetical protein
MIPRLEPIARIVRHEHERWDGTGYPDWLVQALVGYLYARRQSGASA